jgi:hypothetical protein
MISVIGERQFWRLADKAKPAKKTSAKGKTTGTRRLS